MLEEGISEEEVVLIGEAEEQEIRVEMPEEEVEVVACVAVNVGWKNEWMLFVREIIILK